MSIKSNSSTFYKLSFNQNNSPQQLHAGFFIYLNYQRSSLKLNCINLGGSLVEIRSKWEEEWIALHIRVRGIAF